MKTNRDQKHTLSVFAEDGHRVLSKILQIFNRNGFYIDCLSVSRTHVPEIILITLEVGITAEKLDFAAKKIEKIIEVYKAISTDGKTDKNFIAHFRVSGKLKQSDIWPTIIENGIDITINGEVLVFQKIGSEEDIEKVYKLIKMDYLLSFYKTCFVTKKNLIDTMNIF